MRAAAPLAAATALAIFATPARLSGPLLYDDKAAILRNPVVMGEVPLNRVWTVDFWGENELREPTSHKSWRPLVTLSYRANYILHGSESYGYHCVNAVLHAFVSALIDPVAHAAFGTSSARSNGGQTIAAGLTALIFAVHPVHVEAVQNIVGRAELMMSALYLLGFLCYTWRVRHGSASAIVLTLIFALGATLCKETGVTLPALCALWDLLVLQRAHAQRILHRLGYWLAWPILKPGIFPKPTRAVFPTAAHKGCDESKDDRSSRGCVGRCVALLAGMASLCAWRLSLNGGTSPRFNAFENPAALHPHPFFRWVSIAWVWAEYSLAVAFPRELSCDWSYPAIPPISTLRDARLLTLVAFLGLWLLLLIWSAALETPRPRLLISITFGLLPFALASNVVTVVGTSKAERLLYLPSLGGCMAVGLFLDWLWRGGNGDEAAGGVAVTSWRFASRFRSGVVLCAAALLLSALARQCAWYADVWCDGVELWGHAVHVQKNRPLWMRGGVTTHALAEYGNQLSWAGRQAEAAEVLEQQIVLCEQDLRSKHWPTSGRLQAAGYAPLSIVYRLLGDTSKAIEIAERGLKVIQLSSSDRLAAATDPHEHTAINREVARCLAAKSLALYSRDAEQGVGLMRQAIQISGARDAVVLALAKQLNDHIEKVQAGK